MNLYDEIREEMKDIPETATTIDDIFEGLSIAHALTPILRVHGTEGDRQVFLKFASIAIRGLEIADAEIEARKDDN